MSPREPAANDLRVGSELLVRAIPGVPTVEPGDDLFDLIVSALARSETEPRDGDVLVIASKIVSRAEGCFVDLSTIQPSDAARKLGEEVDKGASLEEAIERVKPQIVFTTHTPVAAGHDEFPPDQVRRTGKSSRRRKNLSQTGKIRAAKRLPVCMGRAFPT